MSEKEVTLLSRSPQTCFQSQLEASNINLQIKQEREMLWQYVQHNSTKLPEPMAILPKLQSFLLILDVYLQDI